MTTPKTAGFTLLEMIAALGVFSVVIIIFSSTFLSLLNAERKAQIASTIQNNLRFAVEVMMKEIRTGTGYIVPLSPDNTSIAFFNADNESIVYRASEPVPDPRCPTGEGRRIERSEDGGTSFLPLTSEQICIERLEFLSGGIQPRIQIVVNAAAMIQNVVSALTVQTLISQRKVAVP
ncbi:MAG: type II secretion system protein [Candidatus Niyogibacteria bacterium]|nr:type II secretion system protein [Candidatus Niyogibacteria bacterium]